MTTWTTISNAAVAVGGIPSSTTVTALRDNPSAIAESASGAPVVFAGWHPYDKVSVGDGKTGLIYDRAVDGVISQVVTPDFEDGFEYRLICVDMSHNSASNRAFELWLYQSPVGAYAKATDFGDNNSGANYSLDAIINIPRVSAKAHNVLYAANVNDSASGQSAAVVRDVSTAQKILRARVKFNFDSIDAGQVYLHRRREYISVP
jgi:hypothetical protein